MNTNIKAYDLFWNLYKTNNKFQHIILTNLKKGKIRFFNEEEWNKIESQNFLHPNCNITNFTEMFTLGYNIGNCVGTSKQLSFSYNNVDIVSGILPILKGTKNALLEGGHCWLENPTTIIDTSIMLVIDKSLKELIGYHEEERITSNQLKNMKIYQARKKFVNDPLIKKTNTKTKKK